MAGGAELSLRMAGAGDAAAIAAIYAHHVAHGTASFDFEAPAAPFWTAKIAEIATRGWPFLVAEVEGAVAGYAYASQIRDRPGYRFTCEDSIYVDPAHVARGIGTALLARLIDDARACDFRQMVAVIGGGEPASVALHARAGFREVGRIHQAGFKFDRWLDTVYMQRALA
jgi:L-amino acid N-acyltransferase YncA